MPPVLAYSVDFSHGNLTPSVDINGWGAMKQGNSGAADKPENFSDSKGITLSVFRAPGTPAGHDSSSSIYVVPPGGLDVQSRVLLHAEFDSPWAQPAYVPLSPSNFQTITSNTTPAASPWAVGLACKFGNENDLATDKRVAVTCQFNMTKNGMRLNTPGYLQGDLAGFLDTPLDYANYWPPSNTNLFVFEHLFCGVKSAAAPAGLGYSVGCGELSIGNRHDQRAYSNAGLSDPGAPTKLGALGINLVTATGTGQIMIRLRKFSVSIWS